MLLTLNIGNTNVGYGIFDGTRLLRQDRLPLGELPLLPDRIGAQRIDQAAVVSVRPSRTEQAIGLVAMAYQCPVLVAGQDLPYGIEIECDEPQKVGPDRVVNAVAAFARTRSATIVVDIGTAVTVDVVSRRGDFFGGAIAAGPSTMLRGLHAQAELLPEVAFDKPPSVIGHNTVDAMRSGAYWGTVGLVEQLVARMAEEVTGDPPVILTGGAAELIAKELKRKVEFVPALTLEGLAILVERNAKKK